jgi:prepilin-type N-terminal cleavage/methylation domain-containing protein
MYAIQSRRAFSLIELVIVIVIIGIIGAIAIPRMSRGAAGAADTALTANLAVLRNAIDLFQTEHGGQYPKLAQFEEQLTLFSNDAGATSESKINGTDIYPYGPYLRAVPSLPVGSKKGRSGIGTDVANANMAWHYDESTGKIRANLADSETDERGVSYNKY